MSKYRSAIVGCGPRGRMHALAYDFVSLGELVACCDLDPARRDEFSGEFHLSAYPDAAEMVLKEKPDLVHLVTAPSARLELMMLIESLGVPACIVEKPVATAVRDWKTLTALSKHSRTKFGVGTQFRYHPDLVRCRQVLESGQLGSLELLDFSAIGTICDQGVHGLDWAMSLNQDSPPRRIFGTVCGSENLAHPMHPSPDTSLAQITFENDVTGYWNNGYSARRVLDDLAYYKHGRVTAYAETGRVLYEEFGRWEIVSGQDIQHGSVDDLGWLHGNHLAQAALTDRMFAWLDGGAPVGTRLERALVQWNTVLGLYASAVWKKPVELPFEPPDDLWEQLQTSITSKLE
jgi:predicted dehydrogenase